MKYIYLACVLVVCSVATLLARRKNVALPYFCCVPFLPDDVSIIAGPVNVWGSDILSVITLLLVVARGGLSEPFRFGFIDTLLPVACLYRSVCMLALGYEVSDSLQSGMRWFLPWVLPYFIARMGIQSWDGLKRTIKAMIWIGVLLSFFSIVEAVTRHNVLGTIGVGWNPYEMKYGLYRSHGTFNSIHIFGMFLSLICVMSATFFFADRKKNKRFGIFSIICGIGTIFTTASTGWLQGLLALCFMLLYRFRAYWKLWTYGFLAVNVFIHFVSSRGLHFFYARRLVGLGEAYYRAVLIDEVFSKMPGHWLLGHGENKINLWFVSYEDICNNWLLFLVRMGLLGFLCLVIFYILMLLKLRESYALLSNYRGERIFLWGILSILVSLIVSWFFIALYGSDIAMFSSFFGLVVSLPALARYSLSGKAGQLA